MQMNEEKFNKLPKWAQEEITNLQRKVKDQEKVINTFANEQEETCIYFESGMRNEHKHYISASDVTFLVEPELGIGEYRKLHIYLEKDHIKVMGDLGVIKLIPSAANAVEIYSERL